MKTSEYKSQRFSFNQFFDPITSRAKAQSMIEDAASGFYLVAAIQALIGLFLAHAMLFDAALYAICAFFLRRFHSRVAALIALFEAGGAVIVTICNLLGVTHNGGHNIFLAAIVLIASVRATESAFKLNGKYAREAEESVPSEN